MNESKKACKGCNFTEWCGIRNIRLVNPSNIDLCPCRECLIKVMCKLMCDRRIGVYRDIEETGGVKWEVYPVENV